MKQKKLEPTGLRTKLHSEVTSMHFTLYKQSSTPKLTGAFQLQLKFRSNLVWLKSIIHHCGHSSGLIFSYVMVIAFEKKKKKNTKGKEPMQKRWRGKTRLDGQAFTQWRALRCWIKACSPHYVFQIEFRGFRVVHKTCRLFHRTRYNPQPFHSTEIRVPGSKRHSYSCF